MSKMEESAAKLLDTLTETIQKSVSATENLTEPATQLAVKAIYLESVFHVSFTVLMFLTIICIGFASNKFLKKCSDEDDWDQPVIFLAVGGFMSVFFLTIIFMFRASETINWIGLVSPEARLAMEIINKL